MEQQQQQQQGEVTENYYRCKTMLLLLLKQFVAKINKFCDENVDNPKNIKLISVSEACKGVINSFDETNKEFDKMKYIKKMFYNVKDNCLNEFQHKDACMFTMKNDENKIITMIPQINIKLIYDILDNKERVIFWDSYHLLYFYTFKIFFDLNDKNREKCLSNASLMEVIVKIETDSKLHLEKKKQEKKNETGGVVSDQFNPFITISGSNLQINDMLEGKLSSDEGFSVLEAVTSLFGISGDSKISDITKKFEMEEPYKKLIDFIQNISEDNINGVYETLAENLDCKDNEKLEERTKNLVKSALQKIKEANLEKVEDLLKLGTEISESLGNIDEDEKNIFMGVMQKLVTDNSDILKSITELKDRDGNNMIDSLKSAIGLNTSGEGSDNSQGLKNFDIKKINLGKLIDLLGNFVASVDPSSINTLKTNLEKSKQYQNIMKNTNMSQANITSSVNPNNIEQLVNSAKSMLGNVDLNKILGGVDLNKILGSGNLNEMLGNVNLNEMLGNANLNGNKNNKRNGNKRF